VKHGLTKTLILKIGDPDKDLVDTMERCAEGMNYASKFVCESGRPIGMKLQTMTYAYLRESLKLKSQISCNIPRQVAGAYKTLKEQIKIGVAEWRLLEFRPTSMIIVQERF